MSMADFLRHFSQWFKLSMIHQAELCNEVVEVLVAGINMSLSSHTDDPIKMMDVHMDKDSEQPC